MLVTPKGITTDLPKFNLALEANSKVVIASLAFLKASFVAGIKRPMSSAKRR